MAYQVFLRDKLVFICFFNNLDNRCWIAILFSMPPLNIDSEQSENEVIVDTQVKFSSTVARKLILLELILIIS
jgi:hypothetical protein